MSKKNITIPTPKVRIIIKEKSTCCEEKKEKIILTSESEECEEEETQKCSKCRLVLFIRAFGKSKKNGKYYKSCLKCRDKSKCKHNITKYICEECSPIPLCEHGNRQSSCKECGTGYCEHGKQSTKCVLCEGGSICEHKQIRSRCSECEGGSICFHKKRGDQCRKCSPEAFCEHDILRTRCIPCKGGSICEHDKERTRCLECGGGSYCEHDSRRDKCKICSPLTCLASNVRSRVNSALKSKNLTKNNSSVEYLGCSIGEYKIYIEEKFESWMSWENHGTGWHIDHIIPLMYGDPTEEDVIERLHYTNTQPLEAKANMSKGNRFIG